MLDTQASFITILHWRSQRTLYATKGKRGKNLLHRLCGHFNIFTYAIITGGNEDNLEQREALYILAHTR